MFMATIPTEFAILGQRMSALGPRFQATQNLLEFYLTFGAQTRSRDSGFLGKIRSDNFLILLMEDSQKKFHLNR